MTTQRGRVEAQMVVPAGGAAVVASVGSGASEMVTVPAGSYYLTAAGGVSGLIAELQQQLNDNVQGYPQTAAAMQAALGYGNWTTGEGWLCNETSGSLAAAFGSTALTASGTPTYGTAGPAGGIDKAIGFDATTEYFNGGAILGPTATDDLIIAWVAYFANVPTASICSRYQASEVSSWQIGINGSYYFEGKDATGARAFICNGAPIPLGEWHVGIAVIDRSTGKARIGTQTLSGTSSVASEQTAPALTYAGGTAFHIGDRNGATGSAPVGVNIAAVYGVSGSGVATGLSANLPAALASFASAITASWSASLSATTGLVSLSWSGYATPTYSLAWTSTDLRDLLGFAADIADVTAEQTATKQAHGLWLPDCSLYMEQSPAQAPRVTDLRQSEGPTGKLLGISGNSKYRHRGIAWPAVPSPQVWESEATYDNGSWETFLKDTQFGYGHAWFKPSSRVQIYFNNAGTDAAIGSAFNSGAGISGWFIKGINSCEPPLTRPPYTGLYRIEIPEIVSNG